MHCLYALHSTPEFFLHVSHGCCQLLYSSSAAKLICTVYSVYCVAVGMTVGLLQGRSPPSLCGLPDFFESLSEGAHAWCGTIGMGIISPSLRFHAVRPHAVEGYPTPQICLALQLYCSLLGHISLLPPVFIGTTCGYTGSLTRESPLRVSMDLMQGFCVESQDQVSGLYGSVTGALLSICVFVCIP